MVAVNTHAEQEPILASWKVGEVLARYPGLMEVFIDLSPTFRHLRNPVIRRVQAPLVTVAQAARIAGLEPATVVRSLNAAAGLEGPVDEPIADSDAPAVAPASDAPVAEEVDARPLLARGDEPFRAIMAAASRVPVGQALRLRAPFEPAPLYDVLNRRGFTHAARQLGPDDWEVLFVHVGTMSDAPHETSEEMPTAPPIAGANGADHVIRIDVSDLVPPEPMVRILEAAAHPQPGQTLYVEHVRRPVYLYPQLDARGYVHETVEPEPGRVVIRIRRADGEPS